MDKLPEKEQVVIEYLAGGTTMRKLAKTSGYSRAAISRWVIAERKEMGKRAMLEVSKASKGKDAMPTGVKELQEALRMARLHICLLEATIDISDEQFGTNIRKKLAPCRHENRTKPGRKFNPAMFTVWIYPASLL